MHSLCVTCREKSDCDSWIDNLWTTKEKRVSKYRNELLKSSYKLMKMHEHMPGKYEMWRALRYVIISGGNINNFNWKNEDLNVYLKQYNNDLSSIGERIISLMYSKRNEDLLKAEKIFKESQECFSGESSLYNLGASIALQLEHSEDAIKENIKKKSIQIMKLLELKKA